MRSGRRIAVIMPAWDEAAAIAGVIAAVPAWVDTVIVADNGSRDGTADAARAADARVVLQPTRGYGWACTAGIDASHGHDILVFLDADGSDYPQQMERLVDPILQNAADLVIGSRRLGTAEPGALNPVQRFGNALACRLIRLRWGFAYTDLGPFRAIRRPALLGLGMREMTYGWTVEMQIRALQAGLRVTEVAVDYRRRRGRSKVSGTLRGVLAAGYHILRVILVLAPGRRSPYPS